MTRRLRWTKDTDIQLITKKLNECIINYTTSTIQTKLWEIHSVLRRGYSADLGIIRGIIDDCLSHYLLHPSVRERLEFIRSHIETVP
jgi:hypothetical protein